MASLAFYAGGVAAGLLLGWLFVRLWRLCAPREGNRRFWAALGDITRQMLAVDEVAHLLRLYRRLAVDVGGYVLRNLGGLVLACLPVGAFLLLVAPTALALWDRGAEQVALYPPGTAWASVRAAAPELDGAAPAAVGRTALCWSATRCTAFQLLAFRVIETPAPVVDQAAYVVVRARRGDGNPLWPYLNDLELAFACALMVGSISSLFWRPAAARRAPGEALI